LTAEDASIRSLLDFPNNYTLQAAVNRALVDEMKLRKLEFVTLVGADGKIVAGANANRSGEAFDPSGIVTDVLTNNRRILVSAVMSNSDFRKEQSVRWL
jgi:twitching motility protein PilJ